ARARRPVGRGLRRRPDGARPVAAAHDAARATAGDGPHRRAHGAVRRRREARTDRHPRRRAGVDQAPGRVARRRERADRVLTPVAARDLPRDPADLTRPRTTATSSRGRRAHLRSVERTATTLTLLEP